MLLKDKVVLITGSICAIINIFTQINIWNIKIHILLLPIFFKSLNFIFVSRKEAQRNFKEYGIPTRANNPIVVLFTPTSASHVPKVAEVNKRGSPEKKPIGKKINKFFFKQSFRVSINLQYIFF